MVLMTEISPSIITINRTSIQESSPSWAVFGMCYKSLTPSLKHCDNEHNRDGRSLWFDQQGLARPFDSDICVLFVGRKFSEKP